MTSTTSGAVLDDAVRRVWRAMRAKRVRPPRALVFTATGAGLFVDRLTAAGTATLGDFDGVPHPWRDARLVHGKLGALDTWVCDDRLGEPGWDGEPAWTGGFPCWLGAAAGARVCVHTSAGGALPALDPSDAELAPGSLALVRDHVNLSGDSPLVGLGESALGPLFPDLTRLHHAGLRAAARERAAALGLSVAEVVAACTRGPALETPAESRWLAWAGARVSVQGLAVPLLAAAHAGLRVLAIVAVASAAGEEARVEDVLRQAQATAPAVEDLLVALAGDLARAAGELEGAEA